MKISSNTVINIFLSVIVLGAVIVVIIFGLRFFSGAPRREKEKPLENFVGVVKRTPPDLICYREIKRIKVGMQKLYGIDCGSDDRIYVTGDESLLNIAKEGERARRIDLEEPAGCIATDADGLLYLGMTEHVEVYDSTGIRKAIWASLGSEAIITSIAMAGSEVYVTDAGNRMVMRFDKSGKLRGFIGGKEEAQGKMGFIIPSPYFDVAIGKNATIWVTHTGRFSLENYTPAGTLLWAWGSSSENIEGFCGCCNPTHIAILSDGSFVTSEKGIPRVKVYDPKGDFMCVVAGPECFKEGTVGLDLAVDEQDRIFVLDPGERAVRIFEKK